MFRSETVVADVLQLFRVIRDLIGEFEQFGFFECSRDRVLEQGSELTDFTGPSNGLTSPVFGLIGGYLGVGVDLVLVVVVVVVVVLVVVGVGLLGDGDGLFTGISMGGRRVVVVVLVVIEAPGVYFLLPGMYMS